MKISGMNAQGRVLGRTVRQQRAQRRGYTIVELMMAMAIFAVGFTGVVAIQSVTALANTNAKNLATATALARSWQDRLAIDALRWGGLQSFPITTTRWLSASASGLDNIWHQPANDLATAPTFGPGADARGQFVDFSTDQAGVVFCTQIRLTRLVTTANIGLLRSEVRVFWPKGPDAWQPTDPPGAKVDYCNAVGDLPMVNAIGANTRFFHFVYQTTAIRQTPNF